jgi:hypothetical protein
VPRPPPDPALARDRARARDPEHDALERELETWEFMEAKRMELLAAPAQADHAGGGRPMLPVRTALGALRANAATFERLTDELAYLANLLRTAVRPAGGFGERDAAELAVATCNLGGTCLVWLETGATSTTPGDFEALLAHPAGLERLFRVGWNQLARLPALAASAFARAASRACAGDDHPPPDDDLEPLAAVRAVESGDLETARTIIAGHMPLLGPVLTTRIIALVDQPPRRVEADGAGKPNWFTTMVELHAVEAALTDL